MKILVVILIFIAPLFANAQSFSKRDSVLLGKWVVMYIDTTINSKKKEIKCNELTKCQYIEFTSDGKYTLFYGNTINESGKWRLRNDSLLRYERIAEAAFPEKLKLGGISRMRIEKMKKKQFVLSAYESGKKIKGEKKSFVFYKKLD